MVVLPDPRLAVVAAARPDPLRMERVDMRPLLALEGHVHAGLRRLPAGDPEIRRIAGPQSRVAVSLRHDLVPERCERLAVEAEALLEVLHLDPHMINHRAVLHRVSAVYAAALPRA